MTVSLLNKETLLTPERTARILADAANTTLENNEVARAIAAEATKASTGLATGLALAIGG